MTKINRKIQERLRAGLRCFKPLLKAAKERDASRADTATLALDLLSDLFGFDQLLGGDVGANPPRPSRPAGGVF